MAQVYHELLTAIYLDTQWNIESAWKKIPQLHRPNEKWELFQSIWIFLSFSISTFSSCYILHCNFYSVKIIKPDLESKTSIYSTCGVKSLTVSDFQKIFFNRIRRDSMLHSSYLKGDAMWVWTLPLKQRIDIIFSD